MNKKKTNTLMSSPKESSPLSLSIFSKFIKNNSKLVPFNIKTNDVGETKYFPPFSKEWKNSIYVFNFNNLKNIPVYNININTLVKNYFNFYFNHKFLKNKYKSPRTNRLSLNKIFVSKAEVKHTNSKATITIYTYNRENRVLLKKINKIKNLFYKKILSLLYNSDKLYKNISKDFLKKTIITLLYKELILFRRFKLKLSLNKYKFEEKFLYKLSKLISNFYNKKVEFNLINMKSIVLNSDFFTKILSLKLKDRKVNIIKLMNIVLNKVKFPEVNRVREKALTIKSVNFDLIDNKFKNLNLNSIMAAPFSEKYNMDKLLNSLYYNLMMLRSTSTASQLKKNIKGEACLPLDYKKIYEIIFNSIKYKNMGGIRLEIKGRLTKRYRADRAVFKVKWKGGLKNIDSSYKGLSSVNMRGFVKPNVEYSIYTSKRRIGAFAVKGWISGK